MSKKQKKALSKKDKALIKKTLTRAAMSNGGMYTDLPEFTAKLIAAFKTVGRH